MKSIMLVVVLSGFMAGLISLAVGWLFDMSTLGNCLLGFVNGHFIAKLMLKHIEKT